MDIEETIIYTDNWNDFTPDERVQALLEDHCNCKDIKHTYISEELAEYEVTLPERESLTTFFGNLKDIASEWKIGLITEEGKNNRVRLELWFNTMTLKAMSNKPTYEE